MKWLKPLGNMLIPATIFYIVYHAAGIIPAVALSLMYSIISAVYSKIKGRTIQNSQITGILGLIGSAVAIFFTGNDKLYYVPSIIQNALFLGFFMVLSVQHRSVLHYVAKDFEIESLKQVPEKSMFGVNAIWMVYFALKVVLKIVGILYWNFNTLYWVVFLLGDPMTISVIIISILLIRKHYSKAGESNQ